MFLKYTLLTVTVFLSLFGSSHSRKPANSEEKLLLSELKEILLSDFIVKGNPEFGDYVKKFLNNFPDAFLLNYIRFYENNLQEAATRVLKTIEWRKMNRIEEIVNWKDVPDYIIKNYKYRITGLNDEGVPIGYLNAGEWDFKETLSLGLRDDLLKYGLKIFEKLVERLNIESRTVNETTGLVPPEGVSSCISIISMKNFSFRQVSSIKTMSFLGNLVQIYQSHYPLFCEKVIFINAQQYFLTAFNLLKRLASGQTLDTVEIYREDKNEWLPKIKQYVPEHLLPKEIL